MGREGLIQIVLLFDYLTDEEIISQLKERGLANYEEIKSKFIERNI